MVFNEAETKQLIKSLHDRENALNLERNQIGDTSEILESLLDTETPELEDDGSPKRDSKNKVVMKKELPNDLGTGVKISPSRRNALFDAQKAKANAILNQ